MFFEDNIDDGKYCGHLYGLGTSFAVNGNSFHDNGDNGSNSWYDSFNNDWYYSRLLYIALFTYYIYYCYYYNLAPPQNLETQCRHNLKRFRYMIVFRIDHNAIYSILICPSFHNNNFFSPSFSNSIILAPRIIYRTFFLITHIII